VVGGIHLESVVYLLGAGFSAPLGLPVMTNFRVKSQDMYFDDPEKYAHFQDVFDTIKDLSVIKNFFDANLYNIEEILSILEMEEHLEGRGLRESFVRYIVDVIQHYTPPIRDYPNGLPGNWYDVLFSPGIEQRAYSYFASALLNLRLVTSQGLSRGQRYAPGNYSNLMMASNPNPRVRYSIITLNYDMVLENIADFIGGHFQVEPNAAAFSSSTEQLDRELAPGYEGPLSVSMAKLHGSVHNGVIVAPTWNKSVNREIVPAWKLAYHALANATHLRIIGYSLPTADAYVKFLLKSAIKQNRRLKAIDVLCRDSSGHVRGRYDEFATFYAYRFVNADVMEYLQTHLGQYKSWHEDWSVGYVFDRLEAAHVEFMRSNR
jgi:hypothetical protein